MLLFFPPLRRATTSSSSSPRSADSSYCRGVTSMSGASLRLIKSPGVCEFSVCRCVCVKQREREGGEEGRCSPPPLPPPLPPPPTPPPPSFLPLSPPKSPCREEKVQAWIVKQQWQKFFCLFLFCFSFCGARLQGTKWLPRTGNGENEGEQKLRCFYDLTLFQFQPQLSLLW